MKITSFVALLSVLVLSRLLPLPPNYEPLLGIAVVLPFVVNNKALYYLLPLLVMLVSDYFLGFHNSMYAVYGALSLTTLFTTVVGKPYYGLIGGALIWHILANIGQTFPPFSAEALVFDLRLFASSLLVVVAFDLATNIKRRPVWKILQT